ncbi:aminodeoxychorismate lyase [Alishewanella sp. HL-SH06]|uniref:aminodeoxychorismate lyase n=1 Tax=Alishewanella sp. HL-SH06 TaxID=3461144 RepID=UPI004042ADDE
MSADIILIKDTEQLQIAAGCRALQYGDGVFTTIAIKQGQPQLWPLHLARLQLSVTRLAMPAIDWSGLTQAVLTEAAKQNSNGVIKLLISRGIGGRGYAPSPHSSALVYLYHAQMPDYHRWREQGISVGVAQLRLAIQPALAGLKHTNRLEQVLLKQELAKTDFDDLLVADQQQQLTEATAANLFYQLKGHWYTPPLHLAGVAGVMRQHILNEQAQFQERCLSLAELDQVEAMFICNALLGVAPVRQLSGRALPLEPVQQLQQEMLC